MKHLLDLSQGLYRPEIQGALAKAPTEKFSIEKFHQTTRVNQRFATPFGVAYDSLVGKPADSEKELNQPRAASANEQTAGSANETNDESVAEKKSVAVDVTHFRAQCEQHCRQEFEARLVSLVAEGTGVEIKANVTSTRLYKNPTSEVPLLGFYDVKNAKLRHVFEGEGARHTAQHTTHHTHS